MKIRNKVGPTLTLVLDFLWLMFNSLILSATTLIITLMLFWLYATFGFKMTQCLSAPNVSQVFSNLKISNHGFGSTHCTIPVKNWVNENLGRSNPNPSSIVPLTHRGWYSAIISNNSNPNPNSDFEMTLCNPNPTLRFETTQCLVPPSIIQVFSNLIISNHENFWDYLGVINIESIKIRK